MTLPGEPKIKINPTAEERVGLEEWLEVQEVEDDLIVVRHAVGHGLAGAYLQLARRDACTLADHIGAYLWKPGDVTDDDAEPEAEPAPAPSTAGSPEPEVQATSTAYHDGSSERSIAGWMTPRP